MNEIVVVVEKMASDVAALTKQIERSISKLSIAQHFNKAKAIFIKPNLTYPRYKEGVTTRTEFIVALVTALRRINTSTIICIGEGEGANHSFSMTKAMENMGYYEIEQNFPNVHIVNLSNLAAVNIELKVNNKPYHILLPKIFFDEIDFSITCPVPKVHAMTRITLAMKNQWGCVPDSMRLKHHFVFNQIIPQICDALKFRYVFLDGFYGLDDNGPMAGIPKQVKWFAASNSLGAHDMIVAELMHWDWRDVPHLVEAQRQQFLPARNKIKVIGNIENLSSEFVLRRNIWNYLALTAFKSESFTNIVYLSKFSKGIHTLMYTLRKPVID